jgi:hypothetical protein
MTQPLKPENQPEDDQIYTNGFWRTLILYPVALFLVFEEWGWEPLAAQFDKLARLAIWKNIEALIRRLPPSAALFILLFPLIIILPFKIFGVFLFERGHIASGLAVIVGAKIFGTAIFARLFELSKPALMKFGWFNNWYPRWKKWKDRLLRKIRQTAPWKFAVLLKKKAQSLIKAIVGTTH